MFNTLLSCGLVPLCAILATANPIANPPATVKLQFVSMVPLAEPLFLLGANDEAIAIQVPQNQLSPIIKVPAMNAWALGTKDPANGAIIPEARATPLNTQHQILVITLDPIGAVQLHAVEGSPKEFAPGSFQILNTSAQKVAGDFNNQRFALKSNGHRVVNPQAQGQRVQVGLAKQLANQAAQPFYTGTWRVNPNVKTLVIIHPDANNGRLRLHAIRDFGQQAPPPPAALANPKAVN